MYRKADNVAISNKVFYNFMIKLNDMDYKPTYVKFKSSGGCTYMNYDLLQVISHTFNDMASEGLNYPEGLEIELCESDELLKHFCQLVNGYISPKLINDRKTLYELYYLADKYSMPTIMSNLVTMLTSCTISKDKFIPLGVLKKYAEIDGFLANGLIKLEEKNTYPSNEPSVELLITNLINDITSSDIPHKELQKRLLDELDEYFTRPDINNVFEDVKEEYVLTHVQKLEMKIIKGLSKETFDKFIAVVDDHKSKKIADILKYYRSQ